MKTLYVSDLDGTLLHSNERMSQYSIDTINSLIQSGVLFSYATARSIYSSSVVTESLKLETPVVIHNGVFIINPKTRDIIVRNVFNRDETMIVADFLNRNNIYPLVYSFVDGIERVSWLSGIENDGIQFYLNRRKGDRRLRETFDPESLYSGEVFYLTCIGGETKLKLVYDYFCNKSAYNVILQKELYHPEYWCEFMPKKATKANGIVQVKESLGCDRVVSFGDGLNDIPMFEISDECYAVANAAPELKEKATGIIDTNENDGVAKWLQMLM